MKKINIILFTFLLSFATQAQMVLEYDIATANTQIGIPLAGTVNVSVNWGDGTANQSFTTAGIKNHRYTTTGTKTVTITGNLTAYGSGANLTYNARLTKVLSWDGLGITSFNFAFYNATLLIQVPTSLPTTVTDINYMFYGASKFNQAIGTWNTQNVMGMAGMFVGANAFNQPIGTWNTQNVTNMGSMFQGASTFNQSIGTWNTQNVTNMNGMFAGASVFNQPIENWDTQNVTEMNGMFRGASAFNQPIGTWNTQNVTDMSYMFEGASAFNQDIGTWNTGNVTDMSYMFNSASAFNQAIGNWNTGNVTNLNFMFRGPSAFNQPLDNWNLKSAASMTYMLYDSGLDCSNYSATLRGWAKQPLCPSNINLGSVANDTTNRSYNSTAKNAHDLLVNNKGWTITGDNYVNTTKTTNISTCGSYKNYTQSGVYQDTLWGKNTCDSIVILNLTIKKSSTATLTVSSCNSYKVPSGKRTYTVSGVYKDTLINKAGCDSILTLNVSIKKSSSATISASTCNSYKVPSGKRTYTVSGVYKDTLINKAGCDSILTLNVTIKKSSSATISASTCNSYKVPSGKRTYTVSGTYKDTLVNKAGCDSILTLNVTINKSTTANLTVSTCNSYKIPSGKRTYTVSGGYKDTLVNKAGCDSIVITNLTINKSTKDSVSINTCNTYTSPSGKYKYTLSGVYKDTVINKMGCDSIITLNVKLTKKDTTLFINQCNGFKAPNSLYINSSGIYYFKYLSKQGCDSTVTLHVTIDSVSSKLTYNSATHTLSSPTNNAATYQWYNCETGLSISQAFKNRYTPDSSGIYGVYVSKNSCTSVSSFCYAVTVAPLNNTCDNLSLYPNPGNGNYIIDLGCKFNETIVEVFDVTGNLLLSQNYTLGQMANFEIKAPSGVYTVKVINGNRTNALKLIHFK